MKNIAAFLLIALISFNLFGYLLLVQYFQIKATTELEVKLDRNLYDDARLIELKIPLSMPYMANEPTFQRYDGQVEISGVQYNYVKRKVYNDTLYLLCIPNIQKMHLQNTRDNYFALTNGLHQNKTDIPGKSRIAVKVLQSDYDAHSFYASLVAVFPSQGNDWTASSSDRLRSFPNISPEQPPDQIS